MATSDQFHFPAALTPACEVDRRLACNYQVKNQWIYTSILHFCDVDKDKITVPL
jgi:hypothetical protein